MPARHVSQFINERIYHVMRSVRSFMLLAFAAALMTAFASGVAGASRAIGVEPAGRVSATGRLTFSSRENEVRIISDVTLGAELNRQIEKRAGTVGGTLRTCTVANTRTEGAFGAAARVRCELLTSNLTYSAFLGTLPAITGILFVADAPGFLIEVSGLNNCLYRGRVGVLAGESGAPGGGGQSFDTLRLLGDEVPLVTDLGSFIACPRRGALNGTMTFTPVQRVRLL